MRYASIVNNNPSSIHDTRTSSATILGIRQRSTYPGVIATKPLASPSSDTTRDSGLSVSHRTTPGKRLAS